MRHISRSLSQKKAGITRGAAILALALLPACNLAMPETGFRPSASARAAPYPSLLDQQALAAAARPGTDARLDLPIAERAASLRARAARLAGPVLLPAERRRLQAAAARNAARL